MGLNTATVNAYIATRPSCPTLTIGCLTRVANVGFEGDRSLVTTADSYNTCITLDSTVGDLSIGLAGIYGSVQLLTSNPHYNLTRVGLPRLRPNSSVVPNGIGPIVPRMAGRSYFLIRKLSAAIVLTTSTNRLRLGIVRPIVAFTLFASLGIVAGTYGALQAGYVSNVATGSSQATRVMVRSYNVIALLGPRLKCGIYSRVTRRTCRANGSLRRVIIIRHGLLARRR